MESCIIMFNTLFLGVQCTPLTMEWLGSGNDDQKSSYWYNISEFTDIIDYVSAVGAKCPYQHWFYQHSSLERWGHDMSYSI